MTQWLMQKEFYKRALKTLRYYKTIEERLSLLTACKLNLEDDLTIATGEHIERLQGSLNRINFWLGQYETAKRIILRAIDTLQGDQLELITRHYVKHEKIKDIRAAMGIDSRRYHGVFRIAVDRVAFALYGVDGLTPYARAEYLCNVFLAQSGEEAARESRDELRANSEK